MEREMTTTNEKQQDAQQQPILDRLAALKQQLRKAGLKETSEYRLVGPLTENPHRKAVRHIVRTR
jgi:hypothetical protein